MASSGLYINPPTTPQAPGVPSGAAPYAQQQPPQMPGFGAIRAQGPQSGFDPSYLQNLATSDARLFQQPGGQGLSFNPLGNLTDIPGTLATGGGAAPVQGLPSTWLQTSLAANPFFTPASQSQQMGQQVAANNAANPQTQQFTNWLQQIFGSGINAYGV